VIGVAGLGYWGPNLARNFAELGALSWLCDLDESHRNEVAGRYPSVRATDSFEEMLAADDVKERLLGTEPEHDVEVREAGGYLALVQDVTRWGQLGFRASYYDPNSDFFDSLRGRQVPTSLVVTTLSPMIALHLQDKARLSFQYDFVRDSLAKDASGVPTDAKNNQLTVRLQVEL